MADLIPNIAKGRFAELYNRVKTGDPSNSRLLVVAFTITGGASAQDAGIRDADTLAAVEAVTNVTEVTNTGYARKTIAAAALAAMAPDDTNDRMDIDLPDQTWTSVAAGSAWNKLVVCYIPDGVTPGADSTAIPIFVLDFEVTPDGSDITAQINAAGAGRAS